MAVTTCQEVSYIHTEKAISPIYERRAECQEYLSNFMALMKAKYSQFRAILTFSIEIKFNIIPTRLRMIE